MSVKCPNCGDKVYWNGVAEWCVRCGWGRNVPDGVDGKTVLATERLDEMHVSGVGPHTFMQSGWSQAHGCAVCGLLQSHEVHQLDLRPISGARCLTCGHEQAERNWCERCGHRTEFVQLDVSGGWQQVGWWCPWLETLHRSDPRCGCGPHQPVYVQLDVSADQPSTGEYPPCWVMLSHYGKHQCAHVCVLPKGHVGTHACEVDVTAVSGDE